MPKLNMRSAVGTPTAAPTARTTPAGRASEPAPIVDPNAFDDGRGRTIKVRELTALQQMHLLRFIGDENDAFFNMCMAVARVSTVGERSFEMPTNLMDIEIVVQVLANHGMAALRAHLSPPKAPARSDEINAEP